MDGLTILIVVVVIGIFSALLWLGGAFSPPKYVQAGDPGELSGADLAAWKATRLAEIDAFHANELNAVDIAIRDCNIPWGDFSEAKHAVQDKTRKGQYHIPTGNRGADIGFAIGSAFNASVNRRLAANALEGASLRRTLRDFDDGDRAILRLADILQVLGVFDLTTLRRIQAAIVWSGGKCAVNFEQQHSARDRAALNDGLRIFMAGNFGDRAVAYETVQEALRQSLEPTSSLAAEDRRILERYLFAGSRWMPANDMSPSLSPYALRLGTFEGTQVNYEYDRRESLITIAPPGAGKSQAHLIPNLLAMRGPAVVLDIKAEALKQTARWRWDNVGPIFAFAPGMPKITNHFNPLDGVSREDRAWDEARRLADLLVIPNDSDPYFENRGRDFLTTIVLDVALNEEPATRNMGAVLDRLYLSDDEFETWLSGMRDSKVPMLRRQSNALRSMPRKQREAIFDSARNHLECWQSPALTAITQRSDWQAEALRRDQATLYLCIPPQDLKKYAPVLRVILGQTIAALCEAEAESNVPIVTFFLDEFPRLGRMDVIEEGLDTARGHGVRFWLFCQNYGQLKSTYRNPEGILGNCAVRCYMNPDDDTAEELSRHLGNRQGLIDGRKKPLAEATELKGPEFADKVVVFQSGRSPAKLVRRLAFQARLQAAE